MEHPLIISITNSSNKTIIVENTLKLRNEEQVSTKMGISNIKKRYSFYTNEKIEINQENNIFRVSLPLLKKETKQQIPLQTIN